MVSALQRLGGDDGQSTLPIAIQAFGITGERGIARLLRSHPPIAERIAALRAQAA
jgi:heat shock protein HtpX